MRLFSAEQILILRSEDFFADPQVVYRQTLEFLNLPGWKLKVYKKHDYGSQYQKMDSALRKRLIKYFEPHNQRLYDYLGMSFDWDK